MLIFVHSGACSGVRMMVMYTDTGERVTNSRKFQLLGEYNSQRTVKGHRAWTRMMSLHILYRIIICCLESDDMIYAGPQSE